MENEVQDLAAWLNERAPQADIDHLVRGAETILYQGELLEARNAREQGIFRQLAKMRRKNPATTIDEAAAVFDAENVAKIELGRVLDDEFLSGTLTGKGKKKDIQHWAQGQEQSALQNVKAGDQVDDPDVRDASALKAEIADIEARMKAGRIQVKNQRTGVVSDDIEFYQRRKQEAERALQQLEPWNYILDDSEQNYEDKKRRIQLGIAGKGYKNEMFDNPLRRAPLKDIYNYSDIIDMGSVGDAPKSPLQIASRTNAGVRELAQQLEEYADDPILNEARLRLERSLLGQAAIEADKAEARDVLNRPTKSRQLAGVTGPELLAYIQAEDANRREAINALDVVGSERQRRRQDRILDSIDILPDDPSPAPTRILMKEDVPERLYPGDFPEAVLQGEAWFDQSTGNPLGRQGPEYTAPINEPTVNQVLNAPRSVNRWVNDLSGGYRTGFTDGEAIIYEPQINITESTTRFSDGLRQLGSRVDRRTGQLIWPELANVHPNLRSMEDLQKAVDFILDNAESRGLAFNTFDPETGKQMRVQDPGVEDVMKMMRISAPQQRDLATALGQIKLARDTSYSDRTGVPAGSEVEIYQDPRYRFAGMGENVSITSNLDSLRAPRSVATKLRGIEGATTPDTTKSFIGVAEGEGPERKPERVYKGLTPQEAYDETMKLPYGTPEKARANADQNYLIRMRMAEEAERREARRPGVGGPPPGPPIPEGFRPSGRREIVRAPNAPFGVEEAKRGMQGQSVMNTTPPQANSGGAQLINREVNNRRAPAQESLQRVINTQSPTPVDFIQSEVVGRQTNASSPTTPSSGSIISEMGDGGVPTQDAPRNNVPIVNDTISRDDVPVAPSIGADQEINLEINNRTSEARANAQRATSTPWLQGKKRYVVPTAIGAAGLGGYALYEQGRRDAERREELIRGIR